jgi:hypothetical protein
MSPNLLKTSATLVAIAAGWWLAGGVGGSAAPQDSGPSVKRPASSFSPAAATPASSNRPWSGPTLPLEDFEGIHELRGSSPALNVEHFWRDEPAENEHPPPLRSLNELLFLSGNPLDTLANWLDLKTTERETLKGILHRTAHRQLDWEKANLKAVRLEPGRHSIRWRNSGTEIPEMLRQELREAFGETLARSIWIRGGLDRFLEPTPRWTRRGFEEIDLQLTPSPAGKTLAARLTYGPVTREWNLPADAPDTHFPLRLRHLFDLKNDAAELLAHLPEAAQPGAIPFAQWVKPGFVTSPFNGNVIDVAGIPPGTLVRDPSAPADAKAYFRVPEPE